MDESGISALHFAVLSGLEDIFLGLLEAGASVNLKNCFSHATALHHGAIVSVSASLATRAEN